MKVVFWNGISEAESLTGYVAAIGTILASKFHAEAVLGCNFISNHMLQDCFFSKMKEDGAAHPPYRYLYDSPEYYNALWKMKQNRQGNILEIPRTGVKIVYPPEIDEKRMFYLDIPEEVFYLLELAGESNLVFQGALEEADLIIVFLPQDVAKIQKFFYRYSSLVSKAIFVIVEKHRIDRASYRKIVAEYGIKYKNIGSIPWSKTFISACEEGRLELFLKENDSEKGKQYHFVLGLDRIARLLYERKNKTEQEEVEKHKEI